MAKPENGDWQQSGSIPVPAEWLTAPDQLWVGTILKTYGTGAPVTVGFDYFDIIAGPCSQEPLFRRGDVNIDGAVNIADPVKLLSHLFASQPMPLCPDAADANDDGKLNIADAVKILGYLFASAGPLPAPSELCGVDPPHDPPPDDDLPTCVYDQEMCP
jgi:hypothetical protein